jgi:tetratricopeptide (TPR) repeat protein
MADNARIDDLRKRYHENPRRFFAPLANEYRKTGFVDRALLLCEKHLGEQPDNMNGLVVYGQALFESGRHEDARMPFERALALDPENLIALRHLGDIARLGGDVPTAKSWYLRVLEFDRRNDEVLDLLQQMGVDDSPIEETPSANAAAGLVSVAPNVSVSGADMMDLGMVDIAEPASAPSAPTPPKMPKPSSGPGKTLVINAQALADADRREAAGPSADTKPVPAVAPPAPAKPNKRASLLDVDFDFSELATADASGGETLRIEPAPAPVAPAPPPPTAAPTPALPAGDFELAEFSAEVSPLSGLEATEFSVEAAADAAPLSDLDEPSSLPSAVSPLAGLDRVDLTADAVEPLGGLAGLEPTSGIEHDEPLFEAPMDAALEPAMGAALEPAMDFDLASAPEPAAEPLVDAASDTLGLPMLEDEPIVESPSAGAPRPRMTKSDLASIPLLADYGLEDDEAPAAPAASAAEPRRPQPTPTFVTETMAELYIKQGFRAEAIAVYRQLIEQSPSDDALRARLAALEATSDALPEFEAPAPDAVEPEPAPANAVLADVSFADVGLRTPGAATPVITPAVPAGPSAREFFGAFARRAAVATATVAAVATAAPAPAAAAEPSPSAMAAPSSAWPLDALFGAASEVRDLHAAETLAGIATFEGPDGGTGLGALLSDAPAQRRSVPRASNSLKFDQFFSTPGSPAAPATDGPADDDLDQFQGWLKGLKT